jgi:hypothetical protein
MPVTSDVTPAFFSDLDVFRYVGRIARAIEAALSDSSAEVSCERADAGPRPRCGARLGFFRNDGDDPSERNARLVFDDRPDVTGD